MRLALPLNTEQILYSSYIALRPYGLLILLFLLSVFLFPILGSVVTLCGFEKKPHNVTSHTSSPVAFPVSQFAVLTVLVVITVPICPYLYVPTLQTLLQFQFLSTAVLSESKRLQPSNILWTVYKPSVVDRS